MKTFFSSKSIPADPKYVTIYALEIVLQQNVLKTLCNYAGRQHMVITVTSPVVLLTGIFFMDRSIWQHRSCHALLHHFEIISFWYIKGITVISRRYSEAQNKTQRETTGHFFCCKLQSELQTCLPGDLFFLTCPAYTKYLLYWLGPHIRSKGVLGSASKNAYYFALKLYFLYLSKNAFFQCRLKLLGMTF